MFYPIVRALDFGELARNRFAYRSAEAVLQGLFVLVHGRIFAALTLAQNRFVITARHGRFQIDPRPVHRACGAARFFRTKFAEALRLALQLRREPMSLLRVFAEKILELRISHGISSFFEALLAVLQGFDQSIDR